LDSETTAQCELF